MMSEPTPEQLCEMIQEPPIVRLTDLIFDQALKEGATAIHIETLDDSMRVRFRIRGELVSVMNPPLEMKVALIGRFKELAGLDLHERRIPQQSEWRVQDVHLFVDSIPCVLGEKLCIRIQPPVHDRGIAELDLSPAHLEKLKALLRRRRGLLLVSGGEGMGKSTTLFACLDFLRPYNLSIATIEEPISRRDSDFSQFQLNSRLGFTPAKAIETALKSDSDVIMVDFLRGVGALERAVEAASRGRLVLAGTYHRNAVRAAHSLLTSGVEPGMVADVLSGVVGQRLARKNCANCSGGDCPRCQGSGYNGMIGVHEMLVNSPAVSRLLANQAAETEIRQLAESEGMLDMGQDAATKVERGELSAVELALLFTRD